MNSLEEWFGINKAVYFLCQSFSAQNYLKGLLILLTRLWTKITFY